MKRIIRERTTAAEGHISDMEYKLPPLKRELQSITRIGKAAELKTDDIENRLRRNNIQIVGLPKKGPHKICRAMVAEYIWQKGFRSENAATSSLIPLGSPPTLTTRKMCNSAGGHLQRSRKGSNVSRLFTPCRFLLGSVSWPGDRSTSLIQPRRSLTGWMPMTICCAKLEEMRQRESEPNLWAPLLVNHSPHGATMP